MMTSLKKLRLLLEKKDGYWLAALFIAILGMAFLEVAGIASILPFMHLVANPDLIQTNEWLRWGYTAGGFSSQRSMLLFTGASVLTLFAVSRVFTAFTIWMIHRCVWLMAHRLCMRLLKNYTVLPYEFFLNQHSSQLLRKVVINVNSFVSGVLLAGSNCLAYSILSVVIFGLLVVVHPTLALATFGIFGGAYTLIHLVHHGFLKRLGQQRLAAVYARLRTFSDAITGMKAIKIDGAAPFFTERFRVASKHFAAIHPKYQLFLITPRFTIELLAFGAVLAAVLYLLSAGNDLSETIPVLSLFAVASYRLLPALTKAFNGAAQLSHHLPVIDDVCSDIQHDDRPAKVPSGQAEFAVDFYHQIQLNGIHFRYASTNTDVLCGVDLIIPKHAKIALIGSTGSGKSTLIDLLVGLLLPTEGRLTVDGTVITHQNIASWRQCIAYVPQDVFLYDDTVTSNIAFGIPRRKIDIARVRDAARMAQIDEFIDKDLPEGYETTIGERGVRLSGGQRQRLGLARAFYRKPQLLLLDEATSALDGMTEKAVMIALTRELPDMTVVMVAHRLSTIKDCHRIYLLDQGVIIADGSYEDLMATNRDFRQMVQLTS